MALFNRGNNNDTNGGFNNLNYEDASFDTPNAVGPDSLEFVVPPGPSPKMNSVNWNQAGQFVSDFISNNGIQKTKSVYDNLMRGDLEGAAKEIGTDNAMNLANQLLAFAPAIAVLLSKDIKEPDSISGPKGGYTHYHFNNTRLDLDTSPTEVRFSTGIKPDTFVDDYKFAEDGYSSTVHISSCKLEIPASSTSSLAGTFFSDAILFDLRNAIQRNVTFSVDSTLVSSANLRSVLNHVLYGLQVYYAATRLLVYGNDPMNKNEGLLYLRSTLTSSVIDTYLNLRRVLNGTPISPNMNTLTFYLYQIYASSDLPGSPVIMINPESLQNGVPDWAGLATAVVNLTTENTVKTLSLIGRAIPSWYSTKLLTGIANPLHDPQFTTIWTNLPYSMSGSGYDIKGPPVVDNTTRIYYNSWTNNLDGGAYALTSAYLTSGSFVPSMFTPVLNHYTGSITSSRVSWMNISNVKGYVTAYSNGVAAFGRDETYTCSSHFGATVQTAHQFGTEKCQSVTVRTISNSLYQLMDWMITWNTVTSRSDKALESSGPLDHTIGKYHSGGSKNGSSSQGRKKGSKRPKKTKAKE